jgi:hypothetical protein
MLNTAIPVLAYQLRRMLRELPRTSKKTSPSRGKGAASDADMLPMVAPQPNVCPLRTDYCPGASRVTQTERPVRRTAVNKNLLRRAVRKSHPAVRGPWAGWHHSAQGLPARIACTSTACGRRLSRLCQPLAACKHLLYKHCPLIIRFPATARRARTRSSHTGTV